MNLTKKQEKELLKVYETWWESYLNGDINTYNHYLDEDFRFVGSTAGEEFLNRTDTAAFFEATADQLAGKAKLENVIRSIETLDGMVLITDLADAYILDKTKWEYYARFRFTSLLRHTKNGWRFVYQHFSTPDLKAQEGETLGLEKVTAENLELRTAIKRRTVELELKNRELEIEASLERVRARAMAMKTSDELSDLVNTVFVELTKLDFALSWCIINIIDEPSLSNMVWGANPEIGKPPESYYMKFEDHRFHHEMMAAYQARLSKWVFELKGKEKKDYDDYLFSQTEFKRVPKSVQDQMRSTKKYVASFTFSNFGGIQTIGEVPLSDANLDILARFGQVFDLTYTRFNDLQKAEAQAREAQIEAALERVRTQSMGMQTSEDLSKVTSEMFKQLRQFGGELFATGIVFCDKHKGHVEQWHSIPKAGMMSPFIIPVDLDYIHQYRYDQWKKGTELFSIEIPSDFIEQHFDDIFKLPSAQVVLKEFEANKTPMPSAPDWEIDYGASFKHGYLLVSSLQPFQEAEILPRFAKVFEQTYTRFLDLQKAEAQLRESKIEAGLERLRSRSMAMHKSDELIETAIVLYKELTKLGISPFSTGFVLVDEENSKQEVWFSAQGGEGYMTRFNLPLTGDPVLNKRYRSWKNKETIFHEKVSGKRLLKHLEFVAPYFGTLEAEEEAQKFPDSVVFYCSYFPLGYLHVLSETILDSDQESIMKRFTKVFAMTYTRFLDLQKAEAQAREAQIEAALERVRARTMAMQQSEELAEVATVLFKQVGELGISQWTCGFNIWETGDKEFTFYPGGPDGEILASCKVPLFDHPIFAQFDESRRRGDELLVYEKEGEIQADHYRYMHSLKGIGDMLQGMLDKGLEFPTYQIDHVANFLYGNIIFITYEPFPEMHDVFIRFAKVFEQTYTRFLDLQKAEAQAREAQIEAALERVRARSMAMHQSDELKDVIKEIFDQMAQLDINAEHAGIVVDYEPKKDWHFWVAETQDIPAKITVPYLNLVWDGQFTEAKRKGESFFTTQLDFEEKNNFYKELLPHIEGLTKKAQDFYFSCPGLAASTVIQKDIGLYIENFSGIPYTDEENSILMRIGKVFQQTYTRFLDLQKAEAQGREAQIEAALERVRARSMAMHESSEMLEVANVLFQQLRSLGGNLWGCGVVICQKDVDDDEVWFANENGVLPPVITPHTEDSTHHNMYKGWVNKLELYSEFKEGKELEAHYDYMLSVPNVKPLFENILTSGLSFPTWQKWHAAYFKYGYLLIITLEHYKDEKIFTRFAKVFDQAYTRFLDLQKAEAQAREAQIEAALEKVRSRSLAMHKPEELQEVVAVVAEKLKELGVIFDAGGVILCTYFPDNKDVMHWIAVPDFSSSGSYLVPYFDNPIFNDSWESKNKGDTYFSKEFPVEAKNDFFNHAFENSDYKHFPDDYKQHVLQAEKHTLTAAWSKNSAIIIPSLTGVVPSESDAEIMKRFAKVFEQAYIRFMDLQKVEAQAREAQIEAALEKVRSQSLAMHKSEQLPETAKVLFEQFESLGKVPDRIGICIFDEEAKEFELWGTDQVGSQLDHRFKGSLEEATVIAKMVKAWKAGKDFNIIDLSGQDLKDWIKYTRKNVKLPVDDTRIKGRRVQQAAFFSQGMFLFTSNEPEGEETLSLLVRFAKVFDQAYTRFLDLQKAEAQAREAQIEAALEKVRSRTTGMQKSEELREVIQVIHDQLIQLNFQIDAAGFTLDYHQNNDWNTWIANKSESLPSLMYFPYIDHPQFNYYKSAKEKGLDFLANTLSFEEKNSIFNYMFGFMGDYPQTEKDELLNKPGLAISQAFLKNISLWIYNLDAIPYSDEDNNTLMRFATVFEQTYTRFLDLQKAESQAREAQIEAALEKVRSRTMAMQKGEELKDVVVLLYKELIALGVTNFASCGYVEINEKTNRQSTWVTNPGGDSLGLFYLPLTGDVHFDERYEAWKNQQTVFHQTVAGKERRKHLEYAITTFNSKEAEEMVLNQFPDPTVFYCFNFSHGYLHLVSGSELEEEEESLLARFTRVFEQTYARFLDLKKAEAQAREAQIEAALERTRNQSMQMQHSDEIKDLSKIFHEQLIFLNIPSEFSYVWLPDEDKEEHMFWATWSEKTKASISTRSKSVVYPLDKTEPYTAACYKAWASERPVHESKILPEETGKFFDTWKELLKGAKKLKPSYFPEGIYYAEAYMKFGCFGINIRRSLQNDEADILHRFAIEFERAYTRFLDLQKSEAQAREAQIEVALERVRSQTMAMHNSQDVGKTVLTFFDEVMKLGLNKGIRCGIGILEDREKMETWSATSYPNGDVDLQVGLLDMERHPLIKGLKAAWKNKEDGYIGKLIGEDVVRYYEQLIEEPDYPFHVDLENLSDIEYHRSFFFSSGIIFTFTKTPISEEAALVLNRFASVFGQTYRRFLDLQKAEAQAREARIEASLEKVRARTMAMQSSSELVEAANLLFKQVRDLGINAWSAGYNVLSDDKTQSKCWMSSEDQLQDPFTLYYTEEASFIEMGNFLKGEEDFFVQELGGEDLIQHYDYMKSVPELMETFKGLEKAGLTLPTYQINHLCKFSKGYLLFITYESVPEAHDIFKRFTKVFEQTYTRFLDLEKAEAQAREAEIELALERVRASTMAMHRSEQLAETAEVLFEQFDLLGVTPDRISIAIFNEKKRIFELWATDQRGSNVNYVHDFSIDEPTCMAKTYKAWEEKKETFIVDLKGKALKDWVRYVKEEAKMELDESKFKGRRVQNCAFFSQGYLLLSSHLPISEEILQLLLRFAKVFQQTYTRFLDLQKAEAQAREAIKHASVDRVRAEIASMRNTSDLKRITPLIWNELNTLDVPFIRCGVFIMDEEKQEVQTHLSTPDGKAIASFNLPFENTEPLTELLPNWRKKEMYKDYWDASAFIESMNVLMDRGAISSNESYMTDHQPDNLHLHFLPFLQGMLYVGSEVPLTEDELYLVQNLAEAFSTAYSRYDDFNKLELANKKIEKTLVDLKQTQTQLIQSEKMASLGELTAGIAHEIQNPLNFVNNFSEVSQELMQEMQEELDKGDLAEALEIGNDIEQNLEKIKHHGQRASEIVKGMLQHSRSSSGVKELTDINALTDEYLRLAYHGLRAKDKSFNAKLETEFDEHLDKINVIPQDIGRVILNLITNAFFAVNEKKNEQVPGYEPIVTVRTKKVKEGIKISVKDNGNGIPQKILDKIFQPFFTTKPTGQGTGLGLSLSYDIVKAHGGELQVETKEGKGTTFIIKLPV